MYPTVPQTVSLARQKWKSGGMGTGSWAVLVCAEGRVGRSHPQGRSNECSSQSDPN